MGFNDTTAPEAVAEGNLRGRFAARFLSFGRVAAAGSILFLGLALAGFSAVSDATHQIALRPSLDAPFGRLNLDGPAPELPYGELRDSEPPSREPIFAEYYSPLLTLFARSAQNAAPEAADPSLDFGGMRVRRSLVEKILRAAAVTGWDAALLLAIADKESNFAPSVQARTSSATGLFQFIDATWLKVVRDFGARHGLAAEAAAIDGDLDVADAKMRERILDLRRDPYLSALLAAEMLKRDRERIAQRIGRDLTEGETYLAHFLGPDGAESFIDALQQKPDQSAPKLFPKPARANKSIFYASAKGKKGAGRTLADVHGSFEKMMGARLERYRAIGEMPVITAYASQKD